MHLETRFRIVYAIGLAFFGYGSFGGHPWASATGLGIELIGLGGTLRFRRHRELPDFNAPAGNERGLPRNVP